MTAYYNISKQAAIAAGLKHYFTGKPCAKGHIAKRFVSTRTCCQCNDERNTNASIVAFRKSYYSNAYQDNREAALARGRSYNATEEGRASTLVRASRRRAKLRGAEGSFTPADLDRIRMAQRDSCVYCETPLKGKGSLDHVVALSRGGSNWPSNLQWLCRSCNSRKHTKDAIDFAQQLGKLL